MTRIQLGKYNTLTITRYSDHGAYLDGGEAGEILMPKQYVTPESRAGDEVRVFVYLDQEERLVATTETPLAQVGDFAYLQVAWVNEYGAFLHWGLLKDLFVPFREQKMRMEQGRSYIVYVYIDEETGRIVATAKVDRYLDNTPTYEDGQAVEILIWQKTELGFKVIVDNRFAGLVYENEIFQQLHTGMRLPAYVKHLRLDDKLDIALQPQGRGHVTGFADTLYQALVEHDGYLPLTDKSPAEEIAQHFGVSKKVFKQAVGALYKLQRISLEPHGIRRKDA